MERSLSKTDIAKALNSWMWKYIHNPDEFNREFQTVHEFLTESNQGKIPSYGETGAEYLIKLFDELCLELSGFSNEKFEEDLLMKRKTQNDQ